MDKSRGWVLGASWWCGLCSSAFRETRVAFVGVVGSVRETGIAFAGVVGVARETGVAFAGVNGPVLGLWGRALVSWVSNVSVSRRALVSWVSCVSVSCRALVSWVSCVSVSRRALVSGQVLWSGVIVLCPSGWVMR